MRRKPWARPELEACPFYVAQPALLRGNWQTAFDKKQPLHLELGCGKGAFIAKNACRNPDINYIAVDIKSEVLVLAKRKIEAAYAAACRNVNNVRILSYEISLISDVLSPNDTVDCIYINFCNPWPKPRHQKRRLTHPRQLAQYRAFLRDGGRLLFKTDDRPLYDASLDYLESCDFDILRACDDLYAGGLPCDAPLTEHERMFLADGLPIHFIGARKRD